jgi:uncharacterized protein
MKIQIDDVKDVPKELTYTEEVEELNRRLASGVQDYRIVDGLVVELTHYRAGLDLFFQGALRAEGRGTCSRCAEEYPFPIDVPFTFVLTPRAAGDTVEHELSEDDLSLSFYDGKEIDVTPLVHEQAILALPTRPLCSEECLGLCTRCGANLNAGPCACPPARAPLAVLLGTARAR